MRHLIHKLICWYLRRCAGAFHCYNYGAAGRYIVLMTDDQYHVHQKTERVVREILIAHGSYGDGSNLDKLTRAKCLELLKPLDRLANAEPSGGRPRGASPANSGTECAQGRPLR